MRLFPSFLLLCLLFASDIHAQADGFERLYNGSDLSGWSYLPTTEAQKKGRAGWQKNDPKAPPWPIVHTKVNFDGKATSDDGRFVARGDVLLVSVPEEGRKIQMLYSDAIVRGDFELRLEFRAAHNADSGVFIRGRQLQCRDYPNAGPYRDLKKFKPNDWNELVIVVRGEHARCTCNGEVLEEKFKVPAAGPIGVEGDRGKFEYRNLRLKRNGNLLAATGDQAAWIFEQHKQGKGSMLARGDSVQFDIARASESAWHVQAFQTGLSLEEGAEYQVSFEIRADKEAVVTLQASINQDDWHSIGLYEEIPLETGFKKHRFSFRATDTIKDNRIGFALAKQQATVTLRNFVLEKK